MNKPELYSAANELQRKSVLSYLHEYNHKIKWNKIEDTAIDLGCGDGSVTVLVKNFAPNKYKEFVGCDISEVMIKFANKAYAGEEISFKVMDIEGDLPDDMKGTFNHIFSFYALQLVKDQEKAFRNVFNLMSDEGDCFMTLLASNYNYSIYTILANDPKWKSWLKNVDKFISPYHYMKNPEKKIEEIMAKVGFKNIDVRIRKNTNIFHSVQELKNIVQAVEPFNMPKEVFDDFLQDHLTVGQATGVLRVSNTDNIDKATITYEYTDIVIYATK